MRNILFTVLLGCFVASGLADHEAFQFTDSQGRCWSCSAGQACVPCHQVISPNAPVANHPRNCPAPDCSVVANRGILFPVNEDPTKYYQCAPNGAIWEPVKVPCQCSTFFDFEAGNCQSTWDWQPFCTLVGPIGDPVPCDDPTTPSTTTVVTTTVDTTTTAASSTQPPCNPCMPCMPCFIWWMCSPCNQNQCNNGCSG